MILNCVICNKEFERTGKQALTAKTCSRKCMGENAKAKPNTTCTNCGKEYHLKESAKKRYSRNMGFFCSLKCSNVYRIEHFKGENNHQFGLRGNLNASFKGDILKKKNNNNVDLFKYVGFDYPKNKNGRVLYHRYLVQENFKLFDTRFFDFIDGKYIIKDDLDVHHKDNNHNNNDINNLEIVTRSEHTRIHNKQKRIIRDQKGRIKTVQKINE